MANFPCVLFLNFQTLSLYLKYNIIEGDFISTLEKTYNYILKTVFIILNPFKKQIISTQCKVHQSINIETLGILQNDGYLSEFSFFDHYISDINRGAVWADQDFKSSNHFYNPYKNKGMYGRSNAMVLGTEYHSKAIDLWHKEEFNDSLFYFGAALHIIQDMTVPQHANIRLLDNHRQYETFVKRTYQYSKDFKVDTGAYLISSIEDYIWFNARVAMKIYKHFNCIVDDEQRYYKISRCTLPLAKRTTAGAMVMFYKALF